MSQWTINPTVMEMIILATVQRAKYACAAFIRDLVTDGHHASASWIAITDYCGFSHLYWRGRLKWIWRHRNKLWLCAAHHTQSRFYLLRVRSLLLDGDSPSLQLYQLLLRCHRIPDFLLCSLLLSQRGTTHQAQQNTRHNQGTHSRPPYWQSIAFDTVRI